MNSFLKKWNEELEDLEVNISLGEEEYMEAYETQKANFMAFLDRSAKSIDDLHLEEKAMPIRTKLDELRVQLALGKAESKEAFEKQQKNLTELMHKAGEAYEEAKTDAGEKSSELANSFKEQAEHFRTKLDMFRLHFHLGSADASDEMKEKKNELQEKVRDLKAKASEKAEEMGDEADDKWDEVKEELGEAYDHMKGALKRLFS
jgi:hypothetical protein